MSCCFSFFKFLIPILIIAFRDNKHCRRVKGCLKTVSWENSPYYGHNSPYLPKIDSGWRKKIVL